ncbi:hypothetical protein NC651_017530 [Populus alba x Populus x berolinensis]|nr:hypothetical protein NC651_017530 [Populus alba x Populus x berolinensis]
MDKTRRALLLLVPALVVVWFSNQPGRIFWFAHLKWNRVLFLARNYIGELMFGWPTRLRIMRVQKGAPSQEATIECNEKGGNIALACLV